jgi:hypothetical protein
MESVITIDPADHTCLVKIIEPLEIDGNLVDPHASALVSPLHDKPRGAAVLHSDHVPGAVGRLDVGPCRANGEDDLWDESVTARFEVPLNLSSVLFIDIALVTDNNSAR